MMFNPSKATVTLQSGDSELIEKAVRGDQKAFRQLVNRYLPLVYNYLYRLTQNHEVSEEMAQEAFVKAYSNLKTFDRARPFKPWLLRIASNAAISELRRQSKTVSLNAMEEDGAWHEADFQQAEDTLTSLERQLSSEEVLKALGKMDEKYRQVLLLRYQQDLRYEEIAESLSLPLNTVRTRIKRGLEKLKTTIQEGSFHV